MNFDCSVLWVKDRRHLLDALSLTPEYLRNRASDGGKVIDYKDWQLPLGRRFRALKVVYQYRERAVLLFIRRREKHHADDAFISDLTL